MVETVGEAVALKLEADNSDWTADGFDLQHIRISAVDDQGRTVFDAKEFVEFSVEGPARVIGVDNGDMMTDELHVAKGRSLHRGTALANLRAGREPGRVTFTAAAEGFEPVALTFEVK